MKPSLNTYAAFVFDMDGLLIDSEPLWRQAEMQILNNLGLKLTDDMCKQTMGLRLDEMVEYWYDRFPWNSDLPKATIMDDVAKRILQEVTRLVTLHGQALPGADSLVRKLNGRGCVLAVASSSPFSLIHCVLSKLNLLDCFSVLCSAQDMEFGKPHPAVYLAAAKELKRHPENCIAFEDSLNGVKSAREAGMSVVVVPEIGSNLIFPLGVEKFESLTDVENWLLGN